MTSWQLTREILYFVYTEMKSLINWMKKSCPVKGQTASVQPMHSWLETPLTYSVELFEEKKQPFHAIDIVFTSCSCVSFFISYWKNQEEKNYRNSLEVCVTRRPFKICFAYQDEKI